MKTDPTSSVSGTAGLPLAYEAVQSGRDMATNSNLNTKPKDAISDTLETTDREGDGRQVLDVTGGIGQPEPDNSNEMDRLDLTG